MSEDRKLWLGPKTEDPERDLSRPRVRMCVATAHLILERTVVEWVQRIVWLLDFWVARAFAALYLFRAVAPRHHF